MELEQIVIGGANSIYAISSVKKEFQKAVNEIWKSNPPWSRYQKKLIGDLVVLDQDKEKALDYPQYEKLTGEDNLYSIRHPESKKNVRVLYTIWLGNVILLTAFLEKNDADYQRAIKKAKNRIKWLYS